MSMVLGIDTGGTYTDGVIVERSGKKILASAKALTTMTDLAIGIRRCIENLQFDRFEDISIVSLSTTLATNAIVEGRGCQVGLILIGFDDDEDIPAQEIRRVAGSHDVKGAAVCPLDMPAVREAVLSLKGRVEAVAVSGYLSIRNPEHELAVQALVEELLGLPVVCAHQLSRSLGMRERTVTAVLNARLIPIIKEMLASVRYALEEKGITASIMVVKGDGSLMSEAQAEARPIETILSGPASSLMGAIFLAGERDGLVLDMGGTTTDIAVLKNSVPRIGKKGAQVGGWDTMVEAAEIYTYGLGGDSYIRIAENRVLTVGPQRVCPLSVAAGEYPYYAAELKDCAIDRGYKLLHAQATDGFMRQHAREGFPMSELEQSVWDLLADGPRTLYYLATRLDTGVNLVNLDRLVSAGVLTRISLTPTDILVASGEYDLWSREAAIAGVDIMAWRMNVSREEFIEKAAQLTVGELCYALLQSISNYEGNSFLLKDSAAARYLIDSRLKPSMLESTVRPSIPVIGLGAPARAWLPRMRDRLDCRLIIPPHPEVANAVGSATGRIIETVRMLIHTDTDGDGYVLHSAWEMCRFSSLEEATAYGLKSAETRAREGAEKAGAAGYNLAVDHRHVYARSATLDADADIYIETRIEAVAAERPEWEREGTGENFFVDTRNRGMRLGE